eukprot:GILI01025278.1.p1 GENE.GILI01025278.1~~GILI01025278.1.p1  ORF type:complete len:272 (+),score=62.41 GILI01025278.1:51-818(+)
MDASLSANLARSVQFLSSTSGRDKSCRTIQYLMKLLSSLLRLKSASALSTSAIPLLSKSLTFSDLAVRMESLGGSMSMTRKVLRFGRPIGILQNLSKFLASNSNSGSDKALKAVADISLVVYFLIDHYLYLLRLGLLKAPASHQKAADWWATLAWLGECVCSLALLIRERESLNRKKEMLHYAKELDRVELSRIRAALANNRLDIIKYIVDIPVCLNFLNVSWVSPAACGFFGLISSLIGCYQLFPALPAPAKKE